MPWSTEQLEAATHGQWLHLAQPREFARIITDTRQIQPNDIFLALVGERFDGHDFVAQAITLGASAVIVSHALEVTIPQ